MPNKEPDNDDRLKPLSLHGLTLEQALGGAMQADPPEDDPEPPKDDQVPKKKKKK